MSKSALDMFTKCLALELGPKGIRVNAIKYLIIKIYFTFEILIFFCFFFDNLSPAAVRTNFFEAMGIQKENVDKIFDEKAKQYPLGRVGEPEDIANAILYLASDESSFVTGINLLLDGGALYS